MNNNWLYINALLKSSLTIENNILVIPHPGHVKPVNFFIKQGMPNPKWQFKK